MVRTTTARLFTLALFVCTIIATQELAAQENYYSITNNCERDIRVALITSCGIFHVGIPAGETVETELKQSCNAQALWIEGSLILVGESGQFAVDCCATVGETEASLDPC